jgi:hypothetical protein
MYLKKILFFTEFSMPGSLFEVAIADPSRIYVDFIKKPIYQVNDIKPDMT